MYVRDAMTTVVLTAGPEHSLRDAARRMTERGVGAAVVIDEQQNGPGIITERDILRSVGSGQAPDDERVRDHLTANAILATPDWSLEQAATEMVRGGFRHVIVVDGADVVGILSMRDIVRGWTADAATSELAAGARLG
jgi:CBS domain-containing protein